MRRRLLHFMILTFVLLLSGQLLLSNPIPVPLILEYSVDPPWIEVVGDANLIGDTIRTMGCEAVVLSTQPQDYTILLDSSNTTGFFLFPNGDSIRIPYFFDFGNIIGFGTCGGSAVAPPPGVSAVGGLYSDSVHDYDVCFDFCLSPTPGEWDFVFNTGNMWGQSNLIINEVFVNSGPGRSLNFIELYNAGNSPVQTNDLRLIANSVYEFPSDLVVNPGEYFVINEMTAPELFGFDRTRDVLYLVKYFREPDIYSVVDQVGWSSDHGQDVSLIRYPDGDVDWTDRHDFMGYNDETSYTFENGDPTPGGPNLPHVGIDEESLPGYIDYLECYPNPFNARTTISFSLAAAARVNLSIYDITGRLVEVLADQSYQIGEHSLIWDAGEYPTGVYFAYLNTGRNSLTQRVVLLK